MRTAIIIGATSGIGRQLACSLLESGWRVGIAWRREDRLRKLVDTYGNDRAIARYMDVTPNDAPCQLDNLLTETGAPDLFLHVAGIGNEEGPLNEEIELKIVSTHCDGMVRVVSHFINYIKKEPYYSDKRKVCIGIVSSLAGTKGMGVSPAYSASKKMQSTYVSALSQHVRMHGIPATLSDIRPGFVDTDILLPGTPPFAIMSVEAASRQILKGVARRKRIIVFDWRYRMLSFAWSLIPRWLWERMTFVKTKDNHEGFLQ